jgi:hypothetical protein
MLSAESGHDGTFPLSFDSSPPSPLLTSFNTRRANWRGYGKATALFRDA